MLENISSKFKTVTPGLCLSIATLVAQGQAPAQDTQPGNDTETTITILNKQTSTKALEDAEKSDKSNKKKPADTYVLNLKDGGGGFAHKPEPSNIALDGLLQEIRKTITHGTPPGGAEGDFPPTPPGRVVEGTLNTSTIILSITCKTKAAGEATEAPAQPKTRVIECGALAPLTLGKH